MPGQNLVFYGTGAATNGGAQSNPALYLGRFRSSTRLDLVTSTLTASQTAQSRHYIVDSARIGDGAGAHNLRWILMRTGPAAMSPARVEAFDSTTGTFKLDRPLAATAVSGNSYSIFAKNNVWPDVTAAQALAGDTRYRCIHVQNEHGATISNVRIHQVPLVTSSDISQLAAGKNSGGLQYLDRVSEGDQVDVLSTFGQRELLGGSDNFETANGWAQCSTRAAAVTDEVASITNTQGQAVWLRRILPAGQRRLRRSVAVLIVISTSTGGSDPNPLEGGVIMSYDILGTPTGELQVDRFPRVGGGARYDGTVVDSATGTPIQGRAVKFQIPGGSEGTILTDADPIAGWDTTDADGKVAATYYIPAGATPDVDNHVELSIGAGDELPDP